MSDIEDNYGSQMDRIQNRLEAFEGEGPPSDDALIGVARRGTGSVLGVLESMEDTDAPELMKANLEKLRDDVLEVRVAIEMERGYR